MRALLVDDEKELVSALAERLSFRGVEADWTASPEDAIDMVRKTSYDLAVIDIKMPGMTGLELKKELQTIRPEMKFIFLTGHGSEEDFRVGSAEAAWYLVKPVRIEELMEKMKAALNA